MNGQSSESGKPVWFGYQHIEPADAAANAHWWTASAVEYLGDHGDFLGDADFCWCPEGLRESEAMLLGPLAQLRTKRVLEIGAGAAQCARWLHRQGVEVIATDVSEGMLAQAATLNDRTGIEVPLMRADARTLPFSANEFDVVFTAFGALPFVPDAGAVHQDVARVLRPGGRWAFSVPHPFKWPFPDDPGKPGLTAIRSYFDPTPYVERDATNQTVYAEFHRTIGDYIRELSAAGFQVQDLIEPAWPADHRQIWGGWGPVRGELLPGTAIFITALDP
ncbi:MAG: class I SAM-dependent methyltransferase [Beutenbergiaceae bacterium]